VARDPLSLLMLIAFPALMLVLYGFALNFDVRHVALAVQDRDHSPASRELVTSFVSSTYFDLVATPAPGADLSGLAERRIARAVLVIPEGYGRELASGRSADVHLLVEGADANTATTVLGYAHALVAAANARLLARSLSPAGGLSRAGFAYDPRVRYNRELESTQFLVPGLGGFLLMLTAVLSTALSVVRERERGTMEQIIVTPIRPWQLLVGKVFPLAAIGFVQLHLVTAVAVWGFGVPLRGSFVLLLFLTMLFVLTSWPRQTSHASHSPRRSR
jgi:ABC-2 type transport system permease protein